MANNVVLDPALLKPFTRLVAIDVLGVEVHVPDSNTLLRCFQRLAPEAVSRGRFCWNRACGNSEFTYRLPGDRTERAGRACCFRVVEGMRITQVSEELRRVLKDVLPPGEDAAQLSAAGTSRANSAISASNTLPSSRSIT